MNRDTLIEIVTTNTSASVAQAANAVTAMLAAITSTLAEGQDVKLPGIGILRVKPMAARMARNPKTGEKVSVPPSKKVRLVVAKALKEAVNA